jgi:type I restriction enzyme S subunit
MGSALVLDMEFLPNEQEIYRLHDGDILVSEASGSPDQVGKPVIWKGEIENCCFQNTVIRLCPWVVSSKYLLVIFQDFYFN